MENKGESRDNVFYKSNPDSFASGLNFYKLFWIFLIGSLIGFLVETIYCFAMRGYIESRQGFIYGPVTPIYGLGAVAMSVFLNRLKGSSNFVIFLISAVVGGTFEYLGSLGQEFFTGTVSWQYNDTPFNFQGRTNLRFMVYWGVLGLVFIKYVFPVMSKLIESIPNQIGKIITIILAVFMLFDLIISALAVRREVERYNGVVEASSMLDEFLDEHYDHDFLAKVYPNMIFLDKSSKQH